MFGWRRKNDGFEWHKYVRTTIKLRREQRRARLEEVKHAAVAGLKDAGRASAAAGVSGAAALGRGLSAAAAGTVRLAGRGALGFGWLVYALGVGLIRLFGMALTGAGAALGRLFAAVGSISRITLGAPGLRLAVVLIGLAAMGSAAARLTAEGLDWQSGLAVGIAAGAFIMVAASLGLRIALPPATQHFARAARSRLARLAALQPVLAAAVGLAAIAGLAAGVVWLAASHGRPGALPSFPSLPRLADFPRLADLPLVGRSRIEGQAAVLSGDVFRLGTTVVRLADIEAPEREQRCSRPGNRRWRCGDAAADALTRLVRAKIVTCSVEGRDDAGRTLATCTVDNANVAADLVREGHVFAAGESSRYAVLEKDARTQKAGLWRGEAEHPADYRAKLWESAKRSAPEGCPIKGQVSIDGDKVYVLPWSPTYTRIRVREAQGERWFCSEREAVSAGWRPAEKS